MQVVSSVCFAIGATLQGLGVKSTFAPGATASENKLTIAGLLRLLLVRKWMLGLCFVVVGASIHLICLTFAPVTVVQPVGILAVAWAVLIGARVHSHQITRRMWSAVAVTVLGVVGFTTLSSLFSSQDTVIDLGLIAGAFVLVCLLCAALSLVALRVKVPWAKPMLWSSIGALFYGLASGLMKATMDQVIKHDHGITEPSVLATGAMMLACYVLGLWMIQQGYASGPAEITVGTMTTVDPFAAVLFGVFVLGEGAAFNNAIIFGMAVSAAVAVYGVVLLSRDHPDAVAEREKALAGGV